MDSVTLWQKEKEVRKMKPRSIPAKKLQKRPMSIKLLRGLAEKTSQGAWQYTREKPEEKPQVSETCQKWIDAVVKGK